MIQRDEIGIAADNLMSVPCRVSSWFAKKHVARDRTVRAEESGTVPLVRFFVLPQDACLQKKAGDLWCE
jgi:hypothetical protein